MRRAFFVGLMSLCISATAQETSQHPVINRAATAKFVTLANVPDCVTAFVERGDPSSGASTVLIKMKPSCDSLRHWHTSDASVMVVAGAVRLEMNGAKTLSMRRGDFVFLPSHHIHGERCVASASCMFLASLYSPFDVHYVDEAGKEIEPAEALKGTAKSKQ